MITYDRLPVGHPGRALLSGDTIWFAAQHDPRFSYGLHLPSRYESGTPVPVVVVVHGTDREAQELRSEWAEFSERHTAVVVAPLFPAGITGVDDIDSYKTILAGGVRFDEVLFAILDEVSQRWNLDVGRCHLFGHSGGGQFVNRMLLLHPERLASAVVSAPGRVTLLDGHAPWPRGTADTSELMGIRVNPEPIRRVPVLLTAGEHDDGDADLAAQHDASQDGYGATRLERLRTLENNLRQHGINPMVRLVADATHEDSPTRDAAQAFLATLIQRSHP